MGDRVIVVSALIGSTESIAPAPKFEGVRFICYTDRPAEGWEVMKPPPGYPRQAARRAKMAVLDDFQRVDWSLWLDASYDLLISPADIIQAAIATGCEVAALKHPDRRRIAEEAREIVTHGLAPKDLVHRQMESYRLGGFDRDDAPQTALTTTGLLARKHTPAVHAFTRRWHDELEHWTVRDQLSIDYAAWRTGVEIGYLPGHYRDNKFARYNRTRHRQGRVGA